MTTTLLCWLFLAGGVIAYGVGGANLATGSVDGLRGAIVSRSWWLGTGCQALGFLLTLVARRDLPMLLVQSAVVTALAITALIHHHTGVRRLGWPDWLAISSTTAGVAVVGASTIPGVIPGPTGIDLAVLGATTILLLPPLLTRHRSRAASIIHGCASGIGFGVMAVAARLLVADVDHPLWEFWQLPALSWATGITGVAALLLAQVHLTHALSFGRAVGVFSCMYGLATAFGGLMGWALLGEMLRPGTLPILAVALAVGTLGTARLLKQVEADPS